MSDHTAVKEFLALSIECTMKERKEDADFLGEDLLLFVVKLTKDVDVLERLLRQV